ncbi:hypothetical protein [Hyunsoonleella rubra]|uniref:DUF4138 domain-containing protein n=1 Tax=Hyunsoonleella rubra TaxID=1737062 RepID=A0ABW5TCW6_9FLAO
MKKKHLSFSLLLLLTFNLSSFCQEVEKTFVPYIMIDGKIENFERATSKMESKAIGFGYGGANTYLTIFNSKNSPVRFKSSDLPKFIIQLDKGTDPLDLVVISKADVVKKRKTYRRFVQQGVNGFGGGAKDMSNYFTIPKLKKIKENLYEMVFEKPFEPGEYSFLPIYKGIEAGNIMTTSNGFRIYCFGIDE